MNYEEHRLDLLAAGFKEHSNKQRTAVWSYDVLFQKRVRDEHGTRYFIEAMYWDHHEIRDGWQVEVNFNDGAIFTNLCPMKIQIFGMQASFASWAAADIIRWADELWMRLAPNYYEREN